MQNQNESKSGDPISEWVRRLADGDSKAQRSIWQAYERRLKNCAKQHIKGSIGTTADEDDVAGMVMASLFRRMDDGRINPPEDRQQFWALLRKMTKTKSADLLRRENAIKRGAGVVAGGSQVGSVPGSDFEPDLLMEQAERFVSMINSLGSANLKQVALLRMKNYTTDEIANKMSCSPRTVERRLALIRQRLIAYGGFRILAN